MKITDNARRTTPPILPDLYLENRPLLDRFKDSCREVSVSILSVLSDSLGLEGDARFEQSHRSYMPSNSCLNLFCYPKRTGQNQFGQNKHTDNGSLTLLFANQPGLEILSPKTGIWSKVNSQRGHAVVNVGDTLRFLSEGRFYSSIHRAAPTFGPLQQQRLVIGYFLRAEDDKVVKDNVGNIMTARQWHDRKYENYQADHSVQKKNSILTGGMEEVLN